MAVNYTETSEIKYSTYLNSKIKDIHSLTERIAFSLGYPQINVEAHNSQVHDNIAQACELFTKFAGYTEEYLVFHTSLYDRGKGLYMPTLFSNTRELSGFTVDHEPTIMSNPEYTTVIPAPSEKRLVHSYIVEPGDQKPIEFTIHFIDGYYVQSQKLMITSVYDEDLGQLDVTVAEYDINHPTESPVATYSVETANQYVEIYCASTTAGTVGVSSGDYNTTTQTPKIYNRSMDPLLSTTRKVVDLFSFEEGTTSGINTLFTIEQTLAQQTYFSYAMGKYGFDLISWYTLKEWLEMRSKLLQQKYYWRFNEREQRMYLTPEPKSAHRAEFWGAIGAYVEKPITDILPEPWVYQYALALTKITIARIRGKYQGTSLFGGGSPNYSELLSEGINEKQTLEQRLTDGSSPGFGDAAPPMFFVG